MDIHEASGYLYAQLKRKGEQLHIFTIISGYEVAGFHIQIRIGSNVIVNRKYVEHITSKDDIDDIIDDVTNRRLLQLLGID